MSVEIIGNGHVRELLDAYQIQDLGLEVPDWIDDLDYGYQFFVYKGDVYCMADFMRIEKNAPEWMKEYDGYSNDSFFSGVVVKYAKIEDSYGDMGIKVYTFIA